MKLVSFSINNYRSITKAHKIPLDSSTTIIGKNNEGKSNVLKALNICMKSLVMHSTNKEKGIRPSRFINEDVFNWDRDYPVALQKKPRPKSTKFLLEFQLTDIEIDEFKQVIGSNLNGLLPLEIDYDHKSQFKIKVNKKGRGQATLSKKSDKIALFVAERIEYNYIPAVRTDRDALDIIGRMLSQELRKLESNEEYIKALEKIAELQSPILEALSEKIREPLAEFIPSIKNVCVEIPDVDRRFALRRDINVVIDDGTPTQIEYKGDGVKSLAALALLRSRPVRAPASIIAVEEPESHLHPSAIHQLRDIIYELSLENQVIVSTHNPLFVDRRQIGTNILIESGKVKSAQSIDQIRQMLGVKASDNLTHASLVLIVEGEDDKISLEPIIREMSPTIDEAISHNNLVIVPIGGASKLSYQLTLHSNALCDSLVFFDDDEEGRNAIEKAIAKGDIKPAHVSLSSHQGYKNAEFEDLILKEVYKDVIEDEFGVNLSAATFKTSEKWSNRLRDTFKQQGKYWSDQVESKVKYLVAGRVAITGASAIKPNAKPVIESLIRIVENRLHNK